MAGAWNRNLQGCLRASAIGFAEPGFATIYNLDGGQITTPKPTANGTYGGFDGTNISSLYVSSAGPGSSLAAGRTYLGLVFGDGDDTPTANDLDLEHVVRPTVNNVTNGNYSYANGVASRTVTVTVQNPNVTAMTIREWGLYGMAYSNPSSYFDSVYATSRSSLCLLYRALLDAPVTLQQYESATFTLTLQLTVAGES